MFHVIKFIESNEVDVCPSSWISTKNESLECHWPQKGDKRRMVKNVKPVVPDWPSFQVEILRTFATYDEARKKLPTAQYQSNLESDAPDESTSKKRGQNGNNDDDDDDEGNNTLENQIFDKNSFPASAKNGSSASKTKPGVGNKRRQPDKQGRSQAGPSKNARYTSPIRSRGKGKEITSGNSRSSVQSSKKATTKPKTPASPLSFKKVATRYNERHTKPVKAQSKSKHLSTSSTVLKSTASTTKPSHKRRKSPSPIPFNRSEDLSLDDFNPTEIVNGLSEAFNTSQFNKPSSSSFDVREKSLSGSSFNSARRENYRDSLNFRRSSHSDFEQYFKELMKIELRNEMRLKRLQEDMDELRTQVSRLSSTKYKGPTLQLPFKSLAELNDAEGKLKESDGLKEWLTDKLYMIGGRNPRKAATAMIRKVMEEHVARNFSLCGAQGKQTFNKLELFGIIQDVLNKTFGSKLDDVEEAVSNYLRHIPNTAIEPTTVSQIDSEDTGRVQVEERQENQASDGEKDKSDDDDDDGSDNNSDDDSSRSYSPFPDSE